MAAAISVAFFPAGASIWLKQLQVFGIYAIGYLVRPIAGIIIAHYADKIGPQEAVRADGAADVGPDIPDGAAPDLCPNRLASSRGAAAAAHPPGLRGWWGATGRVGVHQRACAPASGWACRAGHSRVWSIAGCCSVPVRLLCPAWSRRLTPALASLAWRMPFVIGGLFGLMAAYLRRHLAESPMFESIKQERSLSKQTPLVVVLGNYRAQCVVALALVFVFSTTSGVYFQYLPTFLVTQLHFAQPLVFTANIVGVIAFVLGMPLWGWARDRFGWSRTISASAILNAAICVWFFHVIPTLGPADETLIYAFIVVGLGAGCVHAMVPGLISSLFPTAIRQSGFALPYSIGTAVFTGLTPLFLAWLVRDYGLAAPMYQYLAACAMALVIAYALVGLPQFLGTTEAGEVAATRVRHGL